MSLYHAYSQTVADGTATSVVRPSDWNSAHNQQITLAGNTAGQSTISGTNIAFQGGNNVTLSAVTAAGAATIIVSGANTVAQTVQTQASGAIAGTGFTSTTTTGTAITAAMGTNGLSMAVPVFITGFTQSTQTQASGNIAGTGFSSTTTTGTNITATLGNNGLSMAVPVFLTGFTQSTQTQASGNIAGTGFSSTTTGGTDITAALGTNGLNMAVPAFITTFVNDLTSGRAGTGTSLNLTNLTGTLSVNTNGVSLSLSGNAAGGGGGAALQGSGTYTQNTGTIQFANSNGVTFGLTSNQMTASVALQTVQTQNLHNVTLSGNTSGTLAAISSGTMTLAGGNNITLSQVGNAVTISGANAVAQTQQPMYFSASGTSTSSNTLQFGNGNGVSFSLSNGSVVATVKTDYLTTQTVQTQASGNIAGTGFSSTATGGTAITAALGTNGLNMAVPQFITTYVNDLTSGRAGTGTTLALTNLTGTLSVNTNGVALSLNNVDDHLMGWNIAGNTAGTTATTLTTEAPLYLQGGNNITLSGNSNTIVIQGAAGGGGGGVAIAAGASTVTNNTVVFSNANGVSFGLNGSTMTASIIANNTYDGWPPYADLPMVAGQQGQGTLYFEPEHCPYYFQDRVAIPVAYSNANNSTGSVTLSYWVGFYTQNVSTLSLASSTSFSTGFTFSGTVGSWSLYSGMRLLTFPWSLTVQEQEIYIAQLSRTTTGGANASVSQMLVSQINSNFVGFFGASHNTTQQWTQGQGVYTTTTSALPNSVAFSQIRGSDSLAFRAPAIMFINSTV